jgi:hypothetical protein
MMMDRWFQSIEESPRVMGLIWGLVFWGPVLHALMGQC